MSLCLVATMLSSLFFVNFSISPIFPFLCGCDLSHAEAYAAAINFNLSFGYGLFLDACALLPSNVVNRKAKSLTIIKFSVSISHLALATYCGNL